MDIWTRLFPNVQAPAESQWALWLLLHDAAVVKEGIAELALKYHKLKGKMEVDYMVRFASSVMNRLSHA
jgi:hypothetical protein